MLTLIEPKDHTTYRSKIDSLLSFLKIYQNFALSSEETNEATFLIAEDKKHGVYGGAVVYPQKVKNLYPSLARAFLEFLPHKKKIWAIRLCFCLEQDESFLTLEGLDLCERFYKDIYQSLCDISQQKRTPYFSLTLESKDYRRSLFQGRWSYLLEVSPSESSDFRFHGLLVFKEKKDTSQNRLHQQEGLKGENPHQSERSVP